MAPAVPVKNTAAGAKCAMANAVIMAALTLPAFVLPRITRCDPITPAVNGTPCTGSTAGRISAASTSLTSAGMPRTTIGGAGLCAETGTASDRLAASTVISARRPGLVFTVSWLLLAGDLNYMFELAAHRGRVLVMTLATKPDVGASNLTVDEHSGEWMGRVIAQEFRHLVEEAVDGLPEAYRTVFMLRDVEGLSTAETGEGLGLGDETVKTRLHRARAMMRRAVTSRLGEAAAGAFQFQAPRCVRVVAFVLDAIAKC